MYRSICCSVVSSSVDNKYTVCITDWNDGITYTKYNTWQEALSAIENYVRSVEDGNSSTDASTLSRL